MQTDTATSGSRRFGRSIYGKCLWITAMTALLVALLVSVLNLNVIQRIARDGVVDLGATNTSNTATVLGGAVRFQKIADIESQLAQLLDLSKERAIAAVVINAQGEVLAKVVQGSGDLTKVTVAARHALAQRTALSENNGLDIAVPVTFGQENDIVGILAVEWTTAPIMEQLKAEEAQTLVITAVALLGMLGASVLLLRRILGFPLQRLEKAVQAVASGDYRVEIEGAERQDEIGKLARNLDQMRIGLADAKQASDKVAADSIEQQNVIGALTSGLQNLAGGDLTTQISQQFSAQYQQLSDDFNNAARTLHDAMLTVVQNAEMIRQESEDIGRHSTDLSQRTENQAATLEETAAALDQLTGGVKSAADGAREVEQIVKEAQTEANESTQIVTQTVAAMSEIEGSSTQISTIISVIDDIAFQTNLLALNAGVEAARAGEAGRGFAVVASEVRALAQRSSEAAQEIKTLISGSSQHVARGVKLVGETGTVLTSITERVTEIATLTSGMANAASEQSRSLAEINIGVGQLDKATQQNAGMVESADAASQSLRRQAAVLGDTVGRFHTSDGQKAGGARAAA